MNDSTGLERRYRRLLAWYPKAFRRENEEEILAVLLAVAQDGQRRPGWSASMDLLGSALRARMWPAGTPPRRVRSAIRLMFAAAAAQLAVLIITIATAGSVHAAVAHAVPGVALAQHAVNVDLVIDYVSDPVCIAVWLMMAWRLGRARERSRIALTVNLLGMSLGILIAIGEGAAVYAPADLIASIVTWLVVLAANVLVFSGTSNHYYRPNPRPVISSQGPWSPM